MSDPISNCEWTREQQLLELNQRLELARPDVYHRAPSFKPNSDDVVVAVPPKNGTTWLLHICHQIRMQGQEPDFDEQLDVLTWIEGSEIFFNEDPATKKQPVKPYIFFTHFTYPLVPAGGRQIYCFRDQGDAVISAYYYFDSALLLHGRVSLALFAHTILHEEVEIRLNDLLLWWEHRHDDNLLLLFFDDLKEDHAGCVRKIAKFIHVDCAEDVVARVVRTTSHDEMAQHSSKFHTRDLALRVAEKTGEAPPGEDKWISRVRVNGGKSGEGQLLLPSDVKQRIDELWQKIVTTKLGFRTLKEMRDAWKNEN